MLAEPSDADVTPWEEGIRVYAAHVHHSTGSQHAAPDMAQVQPEEHQVDHQTAGVGARYRHSGGQQLVADSQAKAAHRPTVGGKFSHPAGF